MTPSFPTRRSSDLCDRAWRLRRRWARGDARDGEPVTQAGASLPLPVRRIGFGAVADAELLRDVAVEMPVSVEVGGIGYAVMMATPADLEDSAVGFAPGEGLVERAAEVERIDVHRTAGRSEERRVGKEGVSTCSTRGSPEP